MIDEWLQVLSDIIKEDVLTVVRHSAAIGLSTDNSVTKELILYVCILCGKEVKAHFLKIIHISDDTAETIHGEGYPGVP